MAKRVDVGMIQKRKLDGLHGGSFDCDFRRARMTTMGSLHTRNKSAKSAIVVHTERKSLLVWSLLLCGIFLAGQTIGRTSKYLSEKSFGHGATLIASQPGASDAFPDRGRWLGKR